MMENQPLIGILILCLCTLVIFSGCTSPQNENALNQTKTISASAVTATPHPTETKAWVQIDPINNYTTDSSFNIIGSTALIVNGTTSLPAGTKVPVLIWGVNSDGRRVTAETEIRGNGTGPNSFSFSYDVKGLPPGRYRFQIDSDRVMRRTAYKDFTITSDKPYYKWIRMNPPAYSGENLSFSGTTDLPPGSAIGISSEVMLLGCVNEHQYYNRSVSKRCEGECSGFTLTAPVVQGTGGVNSWNATAYITIGCEGNYLIDVRATNWTNATEIHQVV